MYALRKMRSIVEHFLNTWDLSLMLNRKNARTRPFLHKIILKKETYIHTHTSEFGYVLKEENGKTWNGYD